MKTAVIPRSVSSQRCEQISTRCPARRDTQRVCRGFVRRAVEFRRVQTDFAARCDASLAAFERTGISVPSDVVLSKLEAKVAAR